MAMILASGYFSAKYAAEIPMYAPASMIHGWRTQCCDFQFVCQEHLIAHG